MDDTQDIVTRDKRSSAPGPFERSTCRIDCDAEYKIGSSPFRGSCDNRFAGTVALAARYVTPSIAGAALRQEAS